MHASGPHKRQTSLRQGEARDAGQWFVRARPSLPIGADSHQWFMQAQLLQKGISSVRYGCGRPVDRQFCGVLFMRELQCAIAREQHRRDCRLFDDSSPESLLYAGNKGKSGNQSLDNPNNSAISFTNRISAADSLGASACIGDLNLTVWGQFAESVHVQALPLSRHARQHPGLRLLPGGDPHPHQVLIESSHARLRRRH